MSFGDIGNIMKQAQQLQERLAQVQDDVARRTVEAAAGGGMVRVVVNGKHEILSLTIDPAVLKEDVELVQDLVLAAVNEGLRGAQRMIAEEIAMRMAADDARRREFSERAERSVSVRAAIDILGGEVTDVWPRSRGGKA